MDDQYRITIVGIVEFNDGRWESPLTTGFFGALAHQIADLNEPHMQLNSDGTLTMSTVVTVTTWTVPDTIGIVERRFETTVAAADPNVRWRDRIYSAEPVKARP